MACALRWVIGGVLVGCSSSAPANRRVPAVSESVATAAVPTQPASAPPPVARAAPEAVPPKLFEGRQSVRVSELWPALEAVAVRMDSAPAVRSDYAAFIANHALVDTPALFHDYVRVKLAFEATRDGGLWSMRWAVTNRKPQSDAVWAQWQALDQWPSEGPSATAECDELSALFAFVARNLGVDGIGLLWPVWNHVVAVWTVERAGAGPVRVVVPTSQVFLEADASLGTDGFDPWKQKTIYTYRRADVKPDFELPAALARALVTQAAGAFASQPELQARRNAMSERLGGS